MKKWLVMVALFSLNSYSSPIGVVERYLMRTFAGFKTTTKVVGESGRLLPEFRYGMAILNNSKMTNKYGIHTINLTDNIALLDEMVSVVAQFGPKTDTLITITKKSNSLSQYLRRSDVEDMLADATLHANYSIDDIADNVYKIRIEQVMRGEESAARFISDLHIKLERISKELLEL
ncbi:MAG: hypothetical protein HON90_08830 [Halobacteriovoraceae bacterium]|mgnify:CR=1 FL=1|jgi:hypothetical protein|nr:hypothetical protein [Halobacteriovoraceae bacterium]